MLKSNKLIKLFDMQAAKQSQLAGTSDVFLASDMLVPESKRDTSAGALQQGKQYHREADINSDFKRPSEDGFDFAGVAG